MLSESQLHYLVLEQRGQANSAFATDADILAQVLRSDTPPRSSHWLHFRVPKPTCRVAARGPVGPGGRALSIMFCMRIWCICAFCISIISTMSERRVGYLLTHALLTFLKKLWVLVFILSKLHPTPNWQ